MQNSRDLVSLLIPNVVSSAKVCAQSSESARGIPLIFLVVVILINKISTAMINMKGLTEDKGFSGRKKELDPLPKFRSKVKDFKN